MAPISVLFDLPQYISTGLASGNFVRNGGVIQDQAGKVVMWLKETGGVPGVSPSMLGSVDPTGILRLGLQGVDTAVTQSKLTALGAQMTQVQNLAMLTSATSILTLGVSVAGFAIISKKLKHLEGRLKDVQKTLDEVDEKIDLGFYSNFRAALDLAGNAFTMDDKANRRSSALQAIDRFLEAEHVYSDLTDKEIERKSQIGDEYLLTLCLAYIAETRCYLELGEYDTALRRFQEGKEQIRTRIGQYIDLLLTDNPLMYLHPDLKEEVDLPRLARIYRWKDPSANEHSVFELMRESLRFLDGASRFNLSEWSKMLPASVIEQNQIKRGFTGIKDEGRKEILKSLPKAVSEMEEMMETNQRFESYEYEIKLLAKTKVPFSKWLSLKPADAAPEGANLAFILPPQPIAL
ncbi:MAG: hypothetical protein AAFY54_13110 [Cyanobacteria bacterium J06648_10]